MPVHCIEVSNTCTLIGFSGISTNTVKLGHKEIDKFLKNFSVKRISLYAGFGMKIPKNNASVNGKVTDG